MDNCTFPSLNPPTIRANTNQPNDLANNHRNVDIILPIYIQKYGQIVSINIRITQTYKPNGKSTNHSN